MNFKNSIVLALTLFFLTQTALAAEERGIRSTTPPSAERSVFGNYYALIIGINSYKEWYPLMTAVNDAKTLKEVLINQYRFDEDKVVLKIDEEATQVHLISEIKRLASSLLESDNLLIYYAGHGQIDDFTGYGYWIPVDGKLKNPGTWISHSLVKAILSSEKVKAKNIALISDSCYSGILLRSGPSVLSIKDKKYRKKILALSSRRSRQVFTSGGVEPVADMGRDGHSLFAYFFLKALKENNRPIIDLENLFYSFVWKPVAEIGDQRPYVGRLKTPMDENGQFILVSRKVKPQNIGLKERESYASITPKIYEKPLSDGRLKLAIFPRHSTDRLGYKPEKVTFLNNALLETNIFRPIYSYYKLDDKLQENIISADVIDKKEWDSLWIRDNIFSAKKPNIELVIKLGQKLNVDFVYLDSFIWGGRTSWLVSLYLVDVKKKKAYVRNEELDYVNARNVLPDVMEDFFVSYNQ